MEMSSDDLPLRITRPSAPFMSAALGAALGWPLPVGTGRGQGAGRMGAEESRETGGLWSRAGRMGSEDGGLGPRICIAGAGLWTKERTRQALWLEAHAPVWVLHTSPEGEGRGSQVPRAECFLEASGGRTSKMHGMGRGLEREL